MAGVSLFLDFGPGGCDVMSKHSIGYGKVA